VVGVERFPENADEPMATCGMGVNYQATLDGHPLRPGSRQPTAIQRHDISHVCRSIYSAGELRLLGAWHSCQHRPELSWETQGRQ
jgi:hypothetical protein